jgi:hypothetical protein
VTFHAVPLPENTVVPAVIPVPEITVPIPMSVVDTARVREELTIDPVPKLNGAEFVVRSEGVQLLTIFFLFFFCFVFAASTRKKVMSTDLCEKKKDFKWLYRVKHILTVTRSLTPLYRTVATGMTPAKDVLGCYPDCRQSRRSA